MNFAYQGERPIFCQTSRQVNALQTNNLACDYAAMTGSAKPFEDIASRLLWHRELEGLTQQQYADAIGVKRSTLNNWESGVYRLSLDGALAIRERFGLSLDFLYAGIDDALAMTLRRAWRERPLVSPSR
ncbi:MAG: helix-turn-helix transcriptional regulator [Alteromonadaceae bacterium]|nr:helix-turn-helix transcriptional regulator [Alteromonadaceae bacterium]